ncbi:MAG: ThuA domain-containing protein [bacterium]
MKKALIVWGGWDGHTPKASVDVFAPLLAERGFEVMVSDKLDSYANKDLMAAQDLIIPCWTMAKIEGPQSKGLLDAVRAGAGIVGWHGGIIDSFRENTEYQWMTGGQWVAHPGNCIPSYKVAIVDPQHPIVKGLKDFTMPNTEQYYIHVDPGVHVLCNTVFTGEYGDADLYKAGTVMPYAYTKTWGKGKVFVACWGHTNKDFDVPEAREIVLRAMLWAAR